MKFDLIWLSHEPKLKTNVTIAFYVANDPCNICRTTRIHFHLLTLFDLILTLTLNKNKSDRRCITPHIKKNGKIWCKGLPEDLNTAVQIFYSPIDGYRVTGSCYFEVTLRAFLWSHTKNLSKLASFPLVRVCEIDHREGTENLAMIRWQLREISRKNSRG